MTNVTINNSSDPGLREGWQNCEQMQATLGALYTIPMVLLWTMFTGTGVLVTIEMRRYVKSQKKFTIDVKMIVLFLTMYGCYCRTIWALVSVNLQSSSYASTLIYFFLPFFLPYLYLSLIIDKPNE